MDCSTPSLTEDRLSQVSALQVLRNLGHTYLALRDALESRSGRMSHVILGGVLGEQLRRISRTGLRRGIPWS